jgi:hypothetical protein
MQRKNIFKFFASCKGKYHLKPYFLFTTQVDYLPLSLMVTAFKKEDVKKPLEGFGVLIPYKEQQKHGLKTLGRLLFLIW